MLWNAREGSVPVDGTAMRYVAFGRGERRLVILPGLSDGLATVRGKALLLAPPYRRFLDRFTVYIFSRRDKLPLGHTIRQMAQDQAAALDALGIRSAHVMGVSQGGMIAQCLAIDRPDLVERLVLAVTAPSANETVRDRVERWVALARAGDHRALMVDTAEHSYSPAHLAKYRKAYPVLGLVGRPRSYDRFIANVSAILNFDATSELHRICSPTLIVAGGKDQIVGTEAAAQLHGAIAGSSLHVYPDLGHAAYEEAPDFNDRVFGFLEGRFAGP